jgi:hypothetical protein
MLKNSAGIKKMRARQCLDPDPRGSVAFGLSVDLDPASLKKISWIRIRPVLQNMKIVSLTYVYLYFFPLVANSIYLSSRERFISNVFKKTVLVNHRWEKIRIRIR